jgi:hypothetical protein
MKNLSNFIGFLICMLIGVLTATGDIQTYIHFAGVLNEMAFCFMSFMLAGIFMLTVVLPDHKPKAKGLDEKNRF